MAIKARVIIGDAILYHGDCLEVMAEMEESSVDAVVTDPPYGIGTAARNWKSLENKAAAKDYDYSDWDNQPATPEQIAAMIATGKEHIFFGGNYFELPPSPCWLVWDKDNGANNFADCELAWTDLPGAVRRIKFRWQGMLQEDMGDKEVREHPTQKPVAVMEWCLGFVPNAQTILDPFMGSGTTGVACANLGRKFIGVEIELEYFKIACKRIAAAQNQGKIFAVPISPSIQETMF